jgi:hypothetical protein
VLQIEYLRYKENLYLNAVWKYHPELDLKDQSQIQY